MIAAMRNALFVIGFVIEAAGLTLTAIGLWRTWRANTDGREPLWPWLRRCSDFLLYKVLRRKREPITLSVGTGRIGHRAGSATVYGHQPLSDEMTIDQKIEAVQANALSALDSAARAHSAVGKERSEREHALKGFEERISGTEADLRDYAKRLVVDGIPMAVSGLVVTGVGLLVQTVGNVL